MPQMLSRPSGGSILLATPVFGSPTAAYTHSLFETAKAIPELDLVLYAGDCHVDDARNVICREFLASKADTLVFIDADIRWDVNALKRLLEFTGIDIVGASYPFKQAETGFPVRYLDGPMVENDQGLIEVMGLPTGFLRISRRVIEALAKAAPHFLTKSENAGAVPLIFERMLDGQSRLGGDVAFCKKARDAGFGIYLAPEIELDHYGEHRWTGSWAHWQRCERYGPIEAGLIEIQHHRERSKTYLDMVKAWDNRWSVDGAMLACVTELARKHRKVLELGSGLSTLAMAATGAEVHAIEHESAEIIHLENQSDLPFRMYHAPLRDYGSHIWYDIDRIPYDHFDMIVVDGPPRYLGKREAVFDHLPHLLDRATVVTDDLNDGAQSNSLFEWASSNGKTVSVLGPQQRRFGVAA